MRSASDCAIVFCTFPEEQKAAEIARLLVETKLAACASVVPRVRSIYTWQGKTCDEAESLMILKTRRSLLEKLEKEIKARHPYEVPEIVAVDLAASHEPYLKWLLDSTLDE
jgi:periplasmic divalent cation tolerance protein